MRALVLNCTLRPSPEPSSTAALAHVVLDALEGRGVETEMMDPGVVSTPVTDTDEWPSLRARIVAAEIPIIATPTWLGQQSSVGQRVLERMDAMLSETRGRTPACV